MKAFKIIAAIFLGTICSKQTFSQASIGTYQSTYFDRAYDVAASKPDAKGEFSFYIDAASLDGVSKEANLIIRSKQLPEFISFVDSMKRVFVKWKKTAIDNNVTELDKEVEYKKTSYTAGFKYGTWNFDFGIMLTPRFKIIKDKHVMVITSGKLQSSSNQFIKSDGFAIVLSSPDEFDQLMKALDADAINKKSEEDMKKADLFKN
jgi:hypothetical protein